jgi:hypothetical protein
VERAERNIELGSVRLHTVSCGACPEVNDYFAHTRPIPTTTRTSPPIGVGRL